MKRHPSTLTLLLIFVTGFYACRQPETEISTTIEVPVSVIEIGTASIEEFVSTTGSVYPMKEITLSSEMAGEYYIQKNPATGKPYALGDRVYEGAVLIRLEDEEYVNSQRIKSKELDLEISKLEFEKQQSLYEKGGATLRELKNAEINLINTRYDLESSNINLDKMDLESPFVGIISEMPYQTDGTRIPAGTVLASVIDYSRLYLEANLPEKYFSSIARGYKVYITSYTNPGDTLAGKITQISPSIDPEARTFKCFVEVENTGGILLPGMFVKADLVVNSAENTIVIPKDIIVSRNRNQIVYVVDKGVANERVISTGLQSEEMIEVKMGLLRGESVVSSGFETLRNQSRVKILR